jgi:Chaperone of endosialidase
MALADKNIVITPNIGSSSDPQIVFSGASSTLGPQNITLKALPDSGGTVVFEGSAGQLFSITNSLTGTLFAVNDLSGLPSIEVLDTGIVRLAQYNGRVLINTSVDDGVSALQVNGQILETSSIALKENINPIENALDSIMQLIGVTYDRKDGSTKNEAGLIAEDVNTVLPSVVAKDKDGNPVGINYSRLSAYLIEAVKSLKAEIDSLKK